MVEFIVAGEGVGVDSMIGVGRGERDATITLFVGAGVFGAIVGSSIVEESAVAMVGRFVGAEVAVTRAPRNWTPGKISRYCGELEVQKNNSMRRCHRSKLYQSHNKITYSPWAPLNMSVLSLPHMA